MNRILQIITGICFCGLFIGGMAIDSESKILTIVLIISLAWFALLIYVNRDQLGPLEEYEETTEIEEVLKPYKTIERIDRRQGDRVNDRRKEDKKRA